MEVTHDFDEPQKYSFSDVYEFVPDNDGDWIRYVEFDIIREALNETIRKLVRKNDYLAHEVARLEKNLNIYTLEVPKSKDK